VIPTIIFHRRGVSGHRCMLCTETRFQCSTCCFWNPSFESAGEHVKRGENVSEYGAEKDLITGWRRDTPIRKRRLISQILSDEVNIEHGESSNKQVCFFTICLTSISINNIPINLRYLVIIVYTEIRCPCSWKLSLVNIS
jgi:hypothetical protein